MAKKRPKEVQAAINKGKKAWKDARNTKPGSSDFSAPTLKKYGTHKCKWDGKYGLTKDGNLYASLTWTILEGKDKGKSHNKYYGIAGDDAEKAQKAMERLAADVQALTGVDTSEDDYEDVESLFELIEDIHNDSPIALTDIKENGEYLSVYIKELVDDEDSDDEDEEDDEEDEEEEEEDEEEEEEEKPKRGRTAKKATASSGGKGGKGGKRSSKSDEDDDDDEEEDEEDSDDEEEEDEEEAQEPEKDDTVQYKPPRAKKSITCIVKTVNKRAGTCSLQEEDGTKKFTDVPWDKLEY